MTYAFVQRLWRLTVALALGGLFSAAMAQNTPALSADEAALLKAEDALFQAEVTHEVAVVRQGFADEAVFVHASGMIQTKADYLRTTEAGSLPIRSVSAQDRVVRIFGDVGVVRGTKQVVVGEQRVTGSYLAVYIRRDGRWQLLDAQSSPAPKLPEHP